MDGTLLDSMRFWRFGALEYAIANDLPMTEEMLVGVFKRGGVATAKMAYEAAGIDVSKLNINLGKEILKFVVPHYLKDVKPKKNVREYLEKLRREGVRCCVATATPKEYAIEALRVHGLDEYFEFVFDETDADCNKAHEQYFERVTSKLGLTAADCVMFEDALYSIRTAKRFGLRVVAVEEKCTFEGPDAVKEYADIYINDFSELL